MIVSDKHKFIYIDVPKTASVTLDSIFTEHCAGYLQRPPIQSNLANKHCRIVPEHAKYYTKIISVRNPYDRMTSFYYFSVSRKVELQQMGVSTFDEFIDYCLDTTLKHDATEVNGLMYRYFPMWKYVKSIGYNVVLKLESLQEDITQLDFLPKDIILPVKNDNRHPSWKEVETPERKEKIQLWAGEDFELFGYEK